MSNKNLDSLLAKLIELRPDWEDEKGKYINLGNSKIYVKAWVIIALIILTLLVFSYNPDLVAYIPKMLCNNFWK